VETARGAYKAAYLRMAETEMRVGEVIHLTWNDGSSTSTSHAADWLAKPDHRHRLHQLQASEKLASTRKGTGRVFLTVFAAGPSSRGGPRRVSSPAVAAGDENTAVFTGTSRRE
jgi:integrase